MGYFAEIALFPCFSQKVTYCLDSTDPSIKRGYKQKLVNITEKNGFVTAATLGTTNIFFVAATKNFAAVTKRFVGRAKLFVVV